MQIIRAPGIVSLAEAPARGVAEVANAGPGGPAADVHSLVDEPRGADGLLQIPGAKQFRRGALGQALEQGRRLTDGSGDKGDALKAALTPTFTELGQHAAAAGHGISHPYSGGGPGDTPTNQPSEFSFAGAGGGGEVTDRSR